MGQKKSKIFLIGFRGLQTEPLGLIRGIFARPCANAIWLCTPRLSDPLLTESRSPMPLQTLACAVLLGATNASRLVPGRSEVRGIGQATLHCARNRVGWNPSLRRGSPAAVMPGHHDTPGVIEIVHDRLGGAVP